MDASDRQTLVRAFIRAAKLQSPANLRVPLESIIKGQFTQSGTEGRILVSSEEAGGTVTFMVPPGFGPAEVMAIAELALEAIESSPDPQNPTVTPRRILRLRPSYRHAFP